MRRHFTAALILLAAAITVAVPLLVLFIASRSADEVRLSADGGRVPVALWVENVIKGVDGPIVQRMGMQRWRAKTLSGDLGADAPWGLLKLREVIGKQGADNRNLRIAEFDESLAATFGIDACNSQSLYPLLGHSLSGTFQSPDLGVLKVEQPLSTSLSAIVAESVDVAAVRCVPPLDHGEYMIAVLRDAQTADQLSRSLATRGQDLFGDGFKEVVRVEPVAQARGSVHAQRARLLTLSARSLLAMLCAVAIVVAAIEVLSRRQGIAIGFMLGGRNRQQVRRALTRLLPSIVCGLLVGAIAAHLAFPDTPAFVLSKALLGVALAVVPAVFAVTAIGVVGVGRGLARASANNIMQSPLVVAGFQGFWCLVSALLVVVVGLQAAVAARVAEMTHIDWGYAPEGLTTVRIAAPQDARDAQAYRDRVMALIDAARGLPGVSAATVMSPAPWRYFGLDDVQGGVVNGWRAGPAILKTLGVRRFDGNDIDAGQASHVVITQNVAAPVSRLLYRGDTPLATMHDVRWNPFDATPPSLSIQSIFDDPQARFELVVRTRGDAPIASQLATLSATIFPDAAIEPAEKVDDVIASRYAPLTALFRIGNIVALATLAISLLLAALVFAQVFSMQRREFAVRLCLGASHWRALRGWRHRVILLAAAGCVAGVVLLGYVNRVLAVSIGGFVASDATQAGIAVAAVVTLTIVAGMTFAWHYLRRLDPAQALRF